MLLQDISVIVVASLIFFELRRRRNRNAAPLPPGPKGLPLLGNALHIPTHHEWLTYEKWGKDFNSDILYLNAAGTSIIVINSHKMAKDLFDSRSLIYSGRPSFPMITDLFGLNWMLPTLPYGAKWKEQRRVLQQYFPAGNTSAYQPRTLQFVRMVLPRLLDTPEDFAQHIKYLVGGIVFSLAYGIHMKLSDDPHIRLADEALESLLDAFVPGKYLVDVIPALKYIPEWVPGAGFQTHGRLGRKIMERFVNIPFAAAEEEIAKGTARPSLTSMVLEASHEGEDAEHLRNLVKEVACVFFGAGSDTTNASVKHFLLAMITYPEVQTKARRELDAVVGRDRLPDFNDEPYLPYLTAIVKEVVRWRPVSGIGLPHLSTEDDIYEGYFIPKNSIVIPNQRMMLYNEDDYPEPEKFMPERFLTESGQLDPNIKDPYTIAFGFGRRICPGFHIALATLWMTAASILSTFELSTAKDGSGNVIEPSMECGTGITSHPLPFKCAFECRSKETEELIRSAAQYDI